MTQSSLFLQASIMSYNNNKYSASNHEMMDDIEQDYAPPAEKETLQEQAFKEELSGQQVGARQRRNRLVSLSLGLAILTAAAVGAYFFLRDNSVRKDKNTVNENFQGTVSLASLEVHSDAQDCWLAIHEKVYDLTDYAPTHPGGAGFVTDYCGQNATKAYQREHAPVLLELIPETLLGDLVLEETVDDSTTTAPSAAVVETTTTPAPTSAAWKEIGNEDDGSDAGAPTKSPTPKRCYQQFYNLEEVAKHAALDDCYYILYEKVYDMTDYIDLHPGGRRRIFQDCGTDATVNYELEDLHDRSLLVQEGMAKFEIGYFGVTTGLGEVPCPGVVIEAAKTDAPVPSPTVTPATSAPTRAPITQTPTGNPVSEPTAAPSTATPTGSPLAAPTAAPSTAAPTALRAENSPTQSPVTATPTAGPTATPTVAPTAEPTGEPSAGPTPGPTRKPTPSPTKAPVRAPTPVVCNADGYTLAQVAQHTDPDFDCWFVLYGIVYDMTGYADEHPGGARFITDECGTDATAFYQLEKKHDQALLEKENMSRFVVGPLISSRRRQLQTTYQLSQVAQHSDSADCWFALYGVVYDMTDYADEHPGGVRFITDECGTDATAFYQLEKKHDEALLQKENMVRFQVGLLNESTDNNNPVVANPCL